jgi:hypothetical protein
MMIGTVDDNGIIHTYDMAYGEVGPQALASGGADMAGGRFRQHLLTGAESSNMEDRRGQAINTSLVQDTFSHLSPAHLMTTAPTPIQPTQDGLQTLAYTILGENNSSVEGMLSVANVIHNRATSGLYSNDPVTVALQPSQFSTWNDENNGGNQENIQRLYPVGSPQYNIALGIATHVFVNNDMPDITGGSIMYHESGVSPYWAPSATGAYGTIEIAGQTFYPTHPVPPLNIPSVATMLDVTPRDISPTPGLVVKGNLDLTHRPQVMTPEGWATVRSIGIEEDGLEVLIPTVSHDGRVMTDDEAISYYQQTGEHMGKFTNPWLAESYATQVHEDQAKNLIELPRPRPISNAATEAALQRFGGGSDLVMMSVTSTLGWNGDAPDKASSIFRNGPVPKELMRSAAGSAYAGVDARVYSLTTPAGIYDGIGQSVDWGSFTREAGVPLSAPPPLKVPAGNPRPDQQTVKLAQNQRELHLPQASDGTLPQNTRTVTTQPDGTVIGEDQRPINSEDRKNTPTTAVSVEVPVRVTAEGLNVYERQTVKVDEYGMPITDTPATKINTVANSAAWAVGGSGRLEAAGHTAQPEDPYSASLSPGRGLVAYGTTDPASIFYSPPAVREQKAAPIPTKVLASASVTAKGTGASGSASLTFEGGARKTKAANPEDYGFAPSLPLGAAPKAFSLGAVAGATGGTGAYGSATLTLPKPVKVAPKPMPITTTIMVRVPNPEYHAWLKASGEAKAGTSATASGSASLSGVPRETGPLAGLPAVAGATAWNVPPPPRTILVPKKVTTTPTAPATPTTTVTMPAAPAAPASPIYVDRFGHPLVRVQTTRYDPDTGRFVPHTRYEPAEPPKPKAPNVTANTNRFLNEQGVDTSGMTAGEQANALKKAMGW